MIVRLAETGAAPGSWSTFLAANGDEDRLRNRHCPTTIPGRSPLEPPGTPTRLNVSANLLVDQYRIAEAIEFRRNVAGRGDAQAKRRLADLLAR
jgi:hypothetical protein